MSKNWLEHKGYIGEVEFCEEDKIYFGKVEGIEDLVSFESESISNIKQSFIEAVEDYISTCKALSKELN